MAFSAKTLDFLFENRDKSGRWLHNNGDGSECPCYGFYITHPDIGSLGRFASVTVASVHYLVVELGVLERLEITVPLRTAQQIISHHIEGTLPVIQFLDAQRFHHIKEAEEGDRYGIIDEKNGQQSIK